MEIKATSKLERKTLTLASLGTEITAGKSLPIKDEDSENEDVQLGIRAGLLELVGEPKGGKKPTKIRCQNASFRVLNINGICMNIMPTCEFHLTELQLSRDDIKEAITKGTIKVLGKVPGKGIDAVSTTKQSTEAKVKLSKLIAAQDKVGRGKSLTTNEEITLNPEVAEVTTEPKTIPVKEKSKVTWNPSGKKIVDKKAKKSDIKNTREGTNVIIDTDAPTSVAAPDIARKNVVVVDPNSSSNINNIKNATVWNPVNDEVTFVDQKQEQERLQNHPTLKNKTLPNSEIELIDE